MKPIQPWQMRVIFGKANKLGLNGQRHDDDLHLLVQTHTGKESIKALSFADAALVLQQLDTLLEKADLPTAPKKPRQHKATAGGFTGEQQSKVWRLLYELHRFDPLPHGTSHGQRLCGIIKRQFGIDAHPAQPFRFLSFAQGGELIEALKGIVTSAEKKYLAKGGGGHG